MSADTVSILLPELILVLAATLIYVGGTFVSSARTWCIVALASVAAAAFALRGQYFQWFLPAGAHVPVSSAAVLPGPLSVDLLGQFVRLLALSVGAVFVLLSARRDDESQTAEYIGTVLMATAGMMLASGAGELTMLFLGLELISIPTYVLLFLGRRDGASAESAAKYFFLSVLSSAVTLYGFSFLYGVGGSTKLADIHAALASAAPGAVPLYAQLGLVLVFAGLGFKIAAVPFHFYAPDVYQGTTPANAGLLAVYPKVAGIAALVRVVAAASPGSEDTIVRTALILSLLTMTLGNVTALWQDNVRRMLAYSSIAHAGYMLIGFAVDGASRGGAGVGVGIDGLSAALFYTAVYAVATAGSFAALAYFGGRSRQIDSLDDLAGVGRTNPIVALAMAVFMFSLTGLPPLAGFWGKFALFSGAVKIGLVGAAVNKLSGWFMVLAIVGVLNAAVSAAYYLRIIGVMYFRDPREGREPAGGGGGAAIAALGMAALVVAVGLGPTVLSKGSDAAARSARYEKSQPTVPASPPPTHHAAR